MESLEAKILDHALIPTVTPHPRPLRRLVCLAWGRWAAPPVTHKPLLYNLHLTSSGIIHMHTTDESKEIYIEQPSGIGVTYKISISEYRLYRDSKVTTRLDIKVTKINLLSRVPTCSRVWIR